MEDNSSERASYEKGLCFMAHWLYSLIVGNRLAHSVGYVKQFSGVKRTIEPASNTSQKSPVVSMDEIG